MKNIIFLDIDGVLNCEEAFKNGYCEYVEWGKGEHHQSFYPPAKKFLNDLIILSDADIVVSSTWRHSGLEWRELPTHSRADGLGFLFRRFN